MKYWKIAVPVLAMVVALFVGLAFIPEGSKAGMEDPPPIQINTELTRFVGSQLQIGIVNAPKVQGFSIKNPTPYSVRSIVFACTVDGKPEHFESPKTFILSPQMTVNLQTVIHLDYRNDSPLEGLSFSGVEWLMQHHTVSNCLPWGAAIFE
jgi:hypothetical protein